MKTVAAIYTAASIIEPIKAIFAETIPGARLVNIYDDSLIPDVIAAGNTITSDVRRRLLAYCRAAEDMGADLILSTCSSMGEAVGEIQPFIKIPILRIDEAMIEDAVGGASAIAILATVDTTMGPTGRLVRAVADRLGKQITVVEAVAQGALMALQSGDAAAHDEALLKTALGVAEQAEVIILAQASMARMQEAIARTTGRKVVTSMRSGIAAVKAALDQQGGAR